MSQESKYYWFCVFVIIVALCMGVLIGKRLYWDNLPLRPVDVIWYNERSPRVADSLYDANYMIPEAKKFYAMVDINEIGFGFRSDGVVVWRYTK